MTDLESQILSIVLVKRRVHGLDIGAELEAHFRRAVGAGSLYRALHRMEENGLLTADWEGEDEPDHRGPPRRYYEITTAGAQAVEEQVRLAEASLAYLRPVRELP